LNKPIHILHIDEDHLYRKLVRHVLEKEGSAFRVSKAASKPEFEAWLAKGNYDLVLTDFNIFGLEGSQVFDAVRLVDPQTPVVIVTGADSEAMATEAIERGATDYVIKTPQYLRWLPHAIRAAVEQQHLQAERRLAEEAITERDASFRLLFANHPQPMWVYDLGTLAFLEVNDAAITCYGYSRDEFLQMRITDIRLAEDGTKTLKCAKKDQSGLQFSGQCRHRLKTGQIIDVEITSRVLKFGGRNAALVIAQDITERKRLEEQLYQSQKMEAVGRLAGGMAHDFNNILMVIIGYSEFLLDRYRDELDPLHKELEQIRRAGERAAALTHQLLAFSRKQVLQPQVLDLNLVVADMVKMLQRLIGEDIDLNIVFEPALGHVEADPNQIEQVILNLVVNARAAMPQGGKLTIETANVELDEMYAHWHPEAKAGSYVMLAVSDTGYGMDAATKAHLFEPFFTTKAQGQGTGLGLATVYGIIKQSGGDIWVYSEPGHGATFKIYLPRIEESGGAPQSNPARAELLQGWETILLVEDDDGVRELLRTLLQSSGYSVLAAANGGEALLICEKYPGPIHLLITDVVMPHMSGHELVERLTLLRPGLRALYISGYTDEAVVHYGMLEPGPFFLQKPFTQADLKHKVRKVLDANV
jgi:two-component system cell cycle sensor histidine kinase/response regulator CckA